jgi:hypothetical protein
MDRGDNAERPPTTRIGPAAGAASRGLSMVVVLVALALVVAVLKPWDWIAAPPVGPGREGAAIAGVLPATSPTVVPTPASPDWNGARPQVACLSGTRWLAVVDQVNGPVTSRSWTRLDLVPATGPLDAAIARTHVYAEAVPRIGFCAPGAAGAPGASAQFLVRAWRLTPREAAPAEGSGAARSGAGQSGAREAVPVASRLVSGGSAADGGALYGPPGWLTVGGAAGRAADPEGAWAARGRPGLGSAQWQADDGQPTPASWAPGTYVFRVSLAGSGPGGAGDAGGTGGSGGGGAGTGGAEVAWFAIELRGPWVGPGASAAP